MYIDTIDIVFILFTTVSHRVGIFRMLHGFWKWFELRHRFPDEQ